MTAAPRVQRFSRRSIRPRFTAAARRSAARAHAFASAETDANPAAFVCDDKGVCSSVDDLDDLEGEASETRTALKEWGAIVEALASGQQTVIFRKGGLRDGGGGFKLEARRFALFPTVYHPAKELDSCTDASRPFVEAKTPSMKDGEAVPMAVVAEVTGAWVTRDSTVLDALRAHHVWSRELLQSRLSWKPDTPITVLELRAKRLGKSSVVELPPDLDTYGGCKSWVDLPVPVPVAGHDVVPALDDEAFGEKQRALRAAMASVDHVGFSKATRSPVDV